MSMTSLVTGSSGFLGGHIVEELCRRGEEVIVLARKTSNLSAIENLDVQIRYADLRDPVAVKEAMKGVDLIFNCAGAVRFVIPYKEIYEINVAATERVVSAAAEAGVKRVIHTSSISALGPDGLLSPKDLKSHRPDIRHGYSRSKTEAEAAFFKKCAEKGIEGVALRPGVIYGPRDLTSAYYWFDFVDKDNAQLVGDGSSRFPLIYISDVVDAFMIASKKEDVNGMTFNIDGPESVSLRMVYDLICKELGKEPAYRSTPFWLAYFVASMSELKAALGGYKYEPRLSRFVIYLFGKDWERPDCSNAMRDLGFRPEVGLEEG
ncbi:MAG: NAD-dependent epimerase/dehydratase family protein, partial [Euryarchaeota archaeon]|nr:NAD-dependent epimerase/dehydratase family protein [Euryarchaeota archaeon]